MATEQASLRGQLTVVTDGTGAGSATLGPAGAYESWQIERFTMTSVSGTIVANAVGTIWRGGIGGQKIDGTYTPWLDISETNVRLAPGELLVLQLVGYPTQTVNLLIEGTRSYQT